MYYYIKLKKGNLNKLGLQIANPENLSLVHKY